MTYSSKPYDCLLSGQIFWTATGNLRFLHVDEYQDTNHVLISAHYTARPEVRNICVIGDPDQSIYAFPRCRYP